VAEGICLAACQAEGRGFKSPSQPLLQSRGGRGNCRLHRPWFSPVMKIRLRISCLRFHAAMPLLSGDRVPDPYFG